MIISIPHKNVLAEVRERLRRQRAFEKENPILSEVIWKAKIIDDAVHSGTSSCTSPYFEQYYD